MNITSLVQDAVTWLTGVLGTVWSSSFTRVPPLSADSIAVCALIAAAAVIIGPVWSLARNAVTIAHEGGHAIVALMTGRRLQGIQLHSDTSGVTVSYGKDHGFGLTMTMLAGYAAPALWGLGCAALVAAGYATGALWLLVILLLLMLTRIRNGYGLMALIASLALVIGLSWWGATGLRTQAAYLLAWFLFLGAIRPLFELQYQRLTGQAVNSDADQLARGTGIPGTIWVLIWFIVAVGALWAGGAWLTAEAGGIPAVFSPGRTASVLRHLGSLFTEVSS